MTIHRCPHPTFAVLDGGQSTTLDLRPPPGQALGIAVQGEVAYVFRDPDVPVTDEDRARYREATGETWAHNSFQSTTLTADKGGEHGEYKDGH